MIPGELKTCITSKAFDTGHVRSCSVHLLDSRATGTSARRGTTTRHASFWHTSSTCSLVNFHHDWVYDSLQLLLLALELILLCQLVLVQPVQSLLHCTLNLLLVTTLEFVFQLLFIQS